MDRIDSDGDGYITTDELNAWIKRVQKRYVYENVAKVWSDYDLDKDNKISWDEYKQATYGYYLGESRNLINLGHPKYQWKCRGLIKKVKEFSSGFLRRFELFSANPEEFEDATDQFSFKKMLPRDERRFRTADLNGDLAAERDEFTAFLHPEEFDHMKDIVVLVCVKWNSYFIWKYWKQVANTFILCSVF